MAPDYRLGRIYVIRNTVNEKLYVGSTVRTLAQRMAQHRKEAAQGQNEILLHKAMRELGADKFYIELVKDNPCERREQLHLEEGKCMREMKATVPDGYNMKVAGRTYSDRYTANCDLIKARAREYYDRNKAHRNAQKVEYRAANLETLKAKARRRHHANKDAMNAISTAYYVANSEAQKTKAKNRYDANKDAINARRRELRAAKRTPAAPGTAEAAAA